MYINKIKINVIKLYYCHLKIKLISLRGIYNWHVFSLKENILQWMSFELALIHTVFPVFFFSENYIKARIVDPYWIFVVVISFMLRAQCSNFSFMQHIRIIPFDWIFRKPIQIFLTRHSIQYNTSFCKIILQENLNFRISSNKFNIHTRLIIHSTIYFPVVAIYWHPHFIKFM